MTSPLPLPASLEYGRVTGRIIRGVGDTTDDADSLPEGVAIPGLKITFAPSAARIVADATVVLPAPVECACDESGYLTYGGEQGVQLIATDSGSPSGWTWRATIFAPTIPAWSFDFELATGQVVDLSTVTPVPASGGAAIVRGEPGRGVASITAEGDAATVTYTDGTTSPLPLPTTAPAVGVGVRAALAERAERRVRVVSIGDSHTEPVGASSHFNGWAALVARDIGGEGGSTIHITPDTTAAVSNTAIEWNAVNHHAAELIWGHSEVTWSGLDGVDAVGVVYLHVGSEEAPNYARPLVSINGAASADAYSSTDVLYTPGTSYRVSWVSGWPGNGSLTIRTPEPAKALVFGILARRDSASSGWDTGTGQGVSWINWSRSGWSSRTWADNLDQWVVTEPMRALPPDVLHIGLGANDAVQGVPPSETEANIAAIITHVRDYAPSVPVIATLSPWCDVHTTVTEAAWADSLNAVASAVEAAGGSVIDLRQIGPESLYPGLWLPGENHFAPAGHRLIADLVGRALT